ncbi:hypothetical protein AUR04nite_31580 [Glutamicibacter uratoxydans]|uniref:Uncharacterized protein n=1 Tax=Glutamicibacter uratoxydans TaxID=43667 RepID=A0A4Y4DRS4_GLUUR|nr:hypothetical protein [Glutamicibacter uratoxydans]GED07626.1 hypothetical protein AUR04nite_31580 [Glutamicibacter uratoxydans]
MKMRLLGVVMLLLSVGVFVFALDNTQRSLATTCWVTSTLLFIAAAMLLLSGIVGSSSATVSDSQQKRRR